MNTTKQYVTVKVVLLLIMLVYGWGSSLLYAKTQTFLTINSDKQSYNQDGSLSMFEGNVKVKYQDVHIASPKAQVKMNTLFRPQSALFEGGVVVQSNLKDFTKSITSDNLTVDIDSNLLIAEGTTQSKFTTSTQPSISIKAHKQIFDTIKKNISASGDVTIKSDDFTLKGDQATLMTGPKGEPNTVKISNHAEITQQDLNVNAHEININLVNNSFQAQGGVKTSLNIQQGKDTKVMIRSDYQEFDKNQNIMIANGHVIINYSTYKAQGPKANVFIVNGKPEKVVFLGRSTISEPFKEIQADHIEMTFSPKNFNAKGNVKTTFLQENDGTNQ